MCAEKIFHPVLVSKLIGVNENMLNVIDSLKNKELTKKEIAIACNIVDQTVNDIIAKLKHAGLIEIVRYKIIKGHKVHVYRCKIRDISISYTIT